MKVIQTRIKQLYNNIIPVSFTALDENEIIFETIIQFTDFDNTYGFCCYGMEGLWFTLQFKQIFKFRRNQEGESVEIVFDDEGKIVLIKSLESGKSFTFPSSKSLKKKNLSEYFGTAAD